MPSLDGVGARRAALQILDGVLRRGQTIDAAAQHLRGLAPKDQGLAIAIAGETMRRLPDLDSLIDSATRQRLPDDSKARIVLRLALAQKVGLGTPDHALVATALPLVDGGPRRLVHGVLGTLLRHGLPAMDAPRLPDAVEQRWRTAWGEEVVLAARRQIAKRPPLDLSFIDDADASAFGGTSLAPRHVRIDSSSVADLPGFAAGRWWVQDLSASLPARLIHGKAKQVLDLAAAPGGKTMQLAAAGHELVSVDSSKARLARLRENLERTNLPANLVAADALTWQPKGGFDAILLDAPCSATGTFRRHPEVLYRARPPIIAASAAMQSRLLARASGWLNSGGVLVYSVCSLEPEEGERVIERFLGSAPGFALDSPMDGELPGFVKPTSQGWIRILPGVLEAEGGLDGFFMARLVRKG